MSGECNKCNEHCVDCRCDENLSRVMLKAVMKLGRSQEYIEKILENDIFQDLSRNNDIWQSVHSCEQEKLERIRQKLMCLSDDLWYLRGILNYLEYESCKMML